MSSIFYLAHDLDDAAVWRRVAMLRRGGAAVDVAGFRRGRGPLPEPARVLGRTENARLGRRVVAVAGATLRRIALRRDYDAVVARNLEMLVLGALAVRRQPAARLVYEVLDVHRAMLRTGLAGRSLRAIERRLLRRTKLLLVSSPAFVSHHLARYGPDTPPVLLVENAVPTAPRLPETRATHGPPGGTRPLTIGWFGILRCAVSLALLDALTRAAPGRYRIVLAGRPALDALPDFHDVVGANEDLRYDGPYAYPDDLPRLYDQVNLAWLVDRYDAGENSDWLLPNRLYESGACGVPPICLAGTEAARRAEALGIGLTLAAPTTAAAADALGTIDAARIATMQAAQAAVPAETFVVDDATCRALVAAVTGPPPTSAEGGR